MEHAARTKERLPDNIENAPELIMGLELFMTGFYTLQSMRGSGYGTEGPIPWIAMRDYCDEYEIEDVQRLDFYELVTRMDHAYLKYKADKLKTET